MSNYRDLAKRIIDYTRTISPDVHMGVREALAYLDMFPDQVPGRTITESEYYEATRIHNSDYDRGYCKALADSGLTVIPDPELEPGPEDVRKLAQALAAAAFDKPWESFDDLARQALKRGVTAPGASDE
ncbi:hypothetical protein [Brevibacterium antiquum]|uniref:Uncharacterized protein n=1 Tax=Brevibacterium antiquum TaxID=234835 RepID=A0A2H1IN84_9MICO|nr:hypothetical protein [Brevibacterium antiquum]SMX76628.1 hypothetical protein BANT10_01114 [Brevibacterium antiquum]